VRFSLFSKQTQTNNDSNAKKEDLAQPPQKFIQELQEDDCAFKGHAQTNTQESIGRNFHKY